MTRTKKRRKADTLQDKIHRSVMTVNEARAEDRFQAISFDQQNLDAFRKWKTPELTRAETRGFWKGIITLIVVEAIVIVLGMALWAAQVSS